MINLECLFQVYTIFLSKQDIWVEKKKVNNIKIETVTFIKRLLQVGSILKFESTWIMSVN